ncbi:MAG: glycosyltransferase, partial [Burkholderiales bacterium]|nr:glycosyltransferase [Phycisphaerae bacterium]
RNWSSPVFGYTGSVHQDRIDIEIVVELAKAFPAATIALVGPNMLNPESVTRLAAHKNIVLPGPVDFSEVASVMSAFDVCIVPHVVNDFTESLSPLKLYEYLASGLPTVSTPVSGFRDYPGLIHLAADASSFVRACEIALSEPQEMAVRRQEIAKQHSWDARLDEIEAVIDSTLDSKASSYSTAPRAAHAV